MTALARLTSESVLAGENNKDRKMASSETVIVKSGNESNQTIEFRGSRRHFTVTQAPNHTTWRTRTGPQPAVQAIQSLTAQLSNAPAGSRPPIARSPERFPPKRRHDPA
jgi:hypothetical protein